MRRSTLAAAFVTLGLIVSACSGDDGDQAAGEEDVAEAADEGSADEDEEPAEEPEEEPQYETEELIIGLVAPNQVYSAVFVAVDQGWFADEGFDADVVMTQSSTASVQQAAAGSVHFAGGTPDAAVFGIEEGAPVTIVSSAIQGSPLSVVARSDVTDWE